MTDRPHRGEIDFHALGRYFRALSVPSRIQLLQKLQVPQSSSEIRLPAVRKDAGHRADRPVSRQTVEAHLRTLSDVGLVRVRGGERGGRRVREYIVNQPRLFTMADEVRRLTLMRPAPSVLTRGTGGGGATAQAAGATGIAPLPPGPALVLVSGPHEGTAYGLRGPGPWTIGRGPDADVALAYDPFVSTSNSVLRRVGHGFRIRTLAGARNGTTVNWRLLAGDEDAALGPSDTVGVGRSLLVFRGP